MLRISCALLQMRHVAASHGHITCTSNLHLVEKNKQTLPHMSHHIIGYVVILFIENPVFPFEHMGFISFQFCGHCLCFSYSDKLTLRSPPHLPATNHLPLPLFLFHMSVFRSRPY